MADKPYVAKEDLYLKLSEVGNASVSAGDRFVVSLALGYSEREGVSTPLEALRAALARIDADKNPALDSSWYVFDRATGDILLFEQNEALIEADLPVES